MRLYNQLEDYEAENALQFCQEMVISDIVSGEFELGELNNDEDIPSEVVKSNKAIKEALKTLQNIEDEQSKLDFVLASDTLMSLAHNLAHGMVATFHYLDYGDRVMFPEDFSHDETMCPECQKEREEMEKKSEEEVPTASSKTNKHKKHNIN